MKKEYDTFIQSLGDFSDGQAYNLTIRDLTPGQNKYESRFVKAVVYSSTEQIDEGAILWLRFPMGLLHPKPWGIKMIEELGEYERL
jgi:hypothetical protein